MITTRSTIGAAILLIASASAVAVWSWRMRAIEPAAARRARAAAAAGRYDDASAALARWRAAAPNDPEADLIDGRILIARGAVVKASDAFKKAVAAGAPRSEAALLRALIAAKTDRVAEALPTLSQRFAEGHAPDRQVDEALAKLYLETFDLGRAAVVIDRWARDYPDDPKPHLWRAEIHARDGGDPSTVLYDYQDALNRDPKLAPALFGLADALRHMHRNAEAAEAFNACLAVEPDHAAAHVGAGRNLLELGDDEAANRHLTRARELDPGNVEPLKGLAETALRRGDWAAALAFLDRATSLDPNDAAVRYRRGVVLARSGKSKEARAELAAADRLRADVARLNAARSYLVGNPHHRETELEIARWLFNHDRDDEGAQWARHLLADRPGDPDASSLLADYHERRGDAGLANFHRLHAASEPPP